MGKATRQAYGEKLAELVAENPKIIVLDADLAGSTKSGMSQKVAPERFFDFGIAEADMIGHAAGFAASGYIPFASSFAMFATGRTWEQIRNSVCYPILNVKICGSHAGITVGEDGVSHQAIEDIAIMRAIPGMKIYVPADENETRAVVEHVANEYGPTYIRTGRASVENVYDSDQIDVTKIHVLRSGNRAAVFACGVCVKSALEAADRLKAEGIDLTVVDVCAIKPCDEEGILNILQDYDLIFTAEEHNTVGGLGGMICELAAEKCPRRIIRLGLDDIFAESGSAADLMKKYQLDGEGLYTRIKAKL